MGDEQLILECSELELIKDSAESMICAVLHKKLVEEIVKPSKLPLTHRALTLKTLRSDVRRFMYNMDVVSCKDRLALIANSKCSYSDETDIKPADVVEIECWKEILDLIFTHLKELSTSIFDNRMDNRYIYLNELNEDRSNDEAILVGIYMVRELVTYVADIIRLPFIGSLVLSPYLRTNGLLAKIISSAKNYVNFLKSKTNNIDLLLNFSFVDNPYLLSLCNIVLQHFRIISSIYQDSIPNYLFPTVIAEIEFKCSLPNNKHNTALKDSITRFNSEFEDIFALIQFIEIYELNNKFVSLYNYDEILSPILNNFTFAKVLSLSTRISDKLIDNFPQKATDILKSNKFPILRFIAALDFIDNNIDINVLNENSNLLVDLYQLFKKSDILNTNHTNNSISNNILITSSNLKDFSNNLSIIYRNVELNSLLISKSYDLIGTCNVTSILLSYLILILLQINERIILYFNSEHLDVNYVLEILSFYEIQMNDALKYNSTCFLIPDIDIIMRLIFSNNDTIVSKTILLLKSYFNKFNQTISLFETLIIKDTSSRYAFYEFIGDFFYFRDVIVYNCSNEEESEDEKEEDERDEQEDVDEGADEGADEEEEEEEDDANEEEDEETSNGMKIIAPYLGKSKVQENLKHNPYLAKYFHPIHGVLFKPYMDEILTKHPDSSKRDKSILIKELASSLKKNNLEGLAIMISEGI